MPIRGSVTLNEWRKNFAKDKTLVAEFPQLDGFAVHSVLRYMKDKQIWDTAITYTDRLVVRNGVITDDGINIEWRAWQTLHEITVSSK